MESLAHMLRSLGFSERESGLYLEILLRGGGSVQNLAHRLTLNRVTVHSAVERLVERGFLSETREGKRRLIFAEPPEALERLISLEQIALDQKRDLIARMAVEVSKIPRVRGHEPSVRIYRGTAGLKTLLDETLACSGELLVIIDIGQFATLLSKEYLVTYYERRAKRNIRSRIVWPAHSFATKLLPESKRLKMDVRIHSSARDWKVGFFCWNDSIGIKSLSEGYLTCTIITNRAISEFFRTVFFKTVWDSLPQSGSAPVLKIGKQGKR